jgi:hypothetical protein
VDCAGKNINLQSALALVWSSIWTKKGSIAEF